MSKDKSGEAQDTLLESISETTWQMYALWAESTFLEALASSVSLYRHRYHHWYLQPTQTPRADHPLPSIKETRIAFLSQDAHSTGLDLPSTACPCLSLTSEKTGPFQSEHVGFWSLCPCSEPFLIVRLAPSGASCSVRQNLNVFYCLYLLCTFPHLFRKAQC